MWRAAEQQGGESREATGSEGASHVTANALCAVGLSTRCALCLMHKFEFVETLDLIYISAP